MLFSMGKVEVLKKIDGRELVVIMWRWSVDS